MHEVRFYIESRFAGTGSANDDYIFVAVILRLAQPAAHGKGLRFCEDDILLWIRVDKWRDILRRAPTSGAVFFPGTEFFSGCLFLLNEQQCQQ